MHTNNGHTILKKFWAEWCQPCKNMEPIVKSVVSDFGNVKLESINVDDDCDAAVEYSVRSIPALVIIKDGKETGRMVGMKSADEIRQFISNHL